MKWLVNEATKTAHLYAHESYRACMHAGDSEKTAPESLRAPRPTDLGVITFCEACKAKAFCHCPPKFVCATCIQRSIDFGKGEST